MVLVNLRHGMRCRRHVVVRVNLHRGIQCRRYVVVVTWLLVRVPLRRLRQGRRRVRCCSMLVRGTLGGRSSRCCGHSLLWLPGFGPPGQRRMVSRGLENVVLGLGFVAACVPFPCRCASFGVVVVAVAEAVVVEECRLLLVLWLRCPSLAWPGVNPRECFHLFCCWRRRSRTVVRCARTSWDRAVVDSLGMVWAWEAWVGILRPSVYRGSHMRRNNYRMLDICRRRCRGICRSRGMRRYTRGRKGR